MAEQRSMEQLAKSMAMEKAADLLIVAGYPPMIRVYSQWKEMGDHRLSLEEAEKLCFSMIDEPQKEAFEKNLDLDFGYHVEDLRFRVNLHVQNKTVAAALRLIPSHVPSFESLLLPPAILDLCNEQSGLVLVTGPTGSGKTTTQAAMIDYINSNQRQHVITIEDPIEYLHPTDKKSIVEQREVGDDTPSFVGSLRHVLRQTPDVVLIGEMRDLETMSTAITAAETGHLVISTLHTNDTVQAIDRMVDIFPASQQTQIRYQLSLSLKGVISQMLFPRIDQPGNVPAIELLLITPAVRNLIRSQKTAEIYSLMEVGRQYGMQTMQHSIAQLVEKGMISKEMAHKAAQITEMPEVKKVA